MLSAKYHFFFLLFLNEIWPGHLNLDRFNRLCTFLWKIWFSCTIAHLDIFLVTNLWLASVLKFNHVDIVVLGKASKKKRSTWCLYRASLYYKFGNLSVYPCVIYANSAVVLCDIAFYYIYCSSMNKHWDTQNNPFSPSDLI